MRGRLCPPAAGTLCRAGENGPGVLGQLVLGQVSFWAGRRAGWEVALRGGRGTRSPHACSPRPGPVPQVLSGHQKGPASVPQVR